MINWVISSSILIIVVASLRSLFRRKISLRLQYTLWLLAAIRLLIPVNFGSSVISIENLTNRFTVQTQNENTIENISTDNIAPSQIQKSDNAVKIYESVRVYENEQFNIFLDETIPDEEPFANQNSVNIVESLAKIASFLWCAGIVILFLTFMISNIHFNRKLRKMRQKIHISYFKLPVYISNIVDTPCLSGIFRPAIYVTESVAEDGMLLQHSIYHELTHYKHGDLFWSLVRCACLVLHWYNPFVWWAGKLSKQDSELACDEATILRLGESERLDYGRTLIQLTCEKRQDLFLTATTMTSERKNIKERIRFIAKRPKLTVYGVIIVLLASIFAVGCTFTNAESEKSSEVTTVSEKNEDLQEIPEPKTEESSSESGETELFYYKEAEENKVCLAVMPDGISKAGGDYRYIIPEDQVKWTDAYKQARSLAIDGKWMTGERSAGIWIVFNDEWTCITEQGLIFNFSKRVEKSEVESFYNLCIEESMKYGAGTPVKPENISTIVSATLEYHGTYTVTDDNILADLRKSLFSSTELRGGAACPFTAVLTLEFRDKSTETIYLATDSCTSWLTDGVYYDYPGYDNIEEIYEIFKENAVTVSDEPQNRVSNAEQIITQADKRLRTGYTEAKITYVDNSEVGWNYYTDNPWKSDEERDVLAQAALKELYTLTGYNVKECVYTTDGRSRFIFGKSAEFIGKSIAFYSRDYGFTLCGDSTPYMGFVNARRAHYSDVQQLDSPYNKAEFSGHAAIPTWFLEHSGVYQGEKIKGYDAFNLDDTVFTHIKLLFDGGYYIVVMDEEIESVHEIMGPYLATPILNVNGDLYYGTDETGPMGDSGCVGGYIESSVDAYSLPKNHGESNFGCIGNPYTFEDGSGKIQVLMDDGEYHLFYHEDLWIY